MTRVISSGSPFGMLTIHPPNEPERRVVANRKNRRYAAKLARWEKTRIRMKERREAERNK